MAHNLTLFSPQIQKAFQIDTMTSSVSTRLILLGLLAICRHVVSSSPPGVDVDKEEDDATKLQKDFGGDADSTQYKHFVAHNQTMTCSVDEHATPFNNQIRGVNLGGWMVLGELVLSPGRFSQKRAIQIVP